MYTIDSNYYQNKFTTIHDLVLNVIGSGLSLDHEILKDEVGTGGTVMDYIVAL